MPTSRLAVWETLLWYIHEVPHLTVLDVGPGHGKAAVLLREYLNEPPEFIDAIELHPPYVEAFGLRHLYDHVIVGDARELTDRQLAIYDVVVMADVIEQVTGFVCFFIYLRKALTIFVFDLVPLFFQRTQRFLPLPHRLTVIGLGLS